MQRLLDALPVVISSSMHRVMLQAVFLLAFNAFLRMGEICLQTGRSKDQIVQVTDIEFHYAQTGPVGVSMLMHQFKHKPVCGPVNIYIDASKPGNNSPQYCPVQSLLQYVSLFRHNSGPCSN